MTRPNLLDKCCPLNRRSTVICSFTGVFTGLICAFSILACGDDDCITSLFIAGLLICAAVVGVILAYLCYFKRYERNPLLIWETNNSTFTFDDSTNTYTQVSKLQADIEAPDEENHTPFINSTNTNVVSVR